MITAQVWNRVLRFQGEAGRPGTAFIASVHGQDYLLTAKHLCGDDREEVINLRHPWTNEGQTFSRVLTRVGELDWPADVAAFKLPSDLQLETVDLPLDAQGMVLSQDSYMLGYPYSLSTQIGTYQQLPLVKKGIIAGVVHGDAEAWTFYVDAVANPGFSGGPLVIRNVDTDLLQIVGVISQNMMAPVQEPTPERPDPPRVQAGLCVVTDATNVMTMLAGE